VRACKFAGEYRKVVAADCNDWFLGPITGHETVQILYTADGILRSRAVFYGLWSKVLCILSSLSDLKELPHVLHTKVWAILTRGLTSSPLSVVGPILDADIFLNSSFWSNMGFMRYKDG
jgi:hypothetical protein